MTRLTRSQSQAQTRARLIAAARELFAREGFAATSVERIAEAAGYSKGAVYANFGGKEDIFLAALRAEGGEHLAPLLGALEQAQATDDVIEALAQWADERARSGNWALTIMEHARLARGDAASLREQEQIMRGYWHQLGAFLITRFPHAADDAEVLGALLFELAYAPALSHVRKPTPGALVRLVLGRLLHGG